MHTSKELLLPLEGTNQDCFLILVGLLMADLNMFYFTVPNGRNPYGRGIAHLSYGPGTNAFGIEGGTLCVL